MYEPNVNIKNPVEINLLYVQARDCILDGTHPCTVDEACQVYVIYQTLNQVPCFYVNYSFKCSRILLIHSSIYLISRVL